MKMAICSIKTLLNSMARPRHDCDNGIAAKVVEKQSPKMQAVESSADAV